MASRQCSRRARRALLLVALGGALAGCGAANAAPGSPPSSSPAKRARVDPQALARLEQRARQTDSDAVVIYHDGELVAEWYFGKPRGPIEAMSATKSIASLAIGRLVDAGKLRLDQPVCELVPEWRQGRKQKITIRQLLDHTSGLQNVPDTSVEIYPSSDFVKLALAAEVIDEPGTVFRYNNKAVNALAAIARIASGKSLDQLARDEIFTPMGITDVQWNTDPAGTPQVMAGLQIRAQDLARLGQMMLDGGTWNGKRILSAEWIAESTRPSQAVTPRYGLLWWLVTDFRSKIADDEVIARWRAGGLDDGFIAKLMPLKDRVFTDRDAFLAAITQAVGKDVWAASTWKRGLPDGHALPAPVHGFAANGYLGQYLVVLPSARLVVVRQRRVPDDDVRRQAPELGFSDFLELARALVPHR